MPKPVFETRDVCPAVERAIWDQMSLSGGEFMGVREMNLLELQELNRLIERRITFTTFQPQKGLR